MVQPIGMPSVLTSPRHLPDRILREEHAPPHNRQYIHAPTRVYDAVAERHPDAAVIIPPRVTAVPSQTTATPRDKHLATIVKHGRTSWQRSSGYNRRSLVETTMFRYKTVIGRRLHARILANQRTEAKIGCNVLNRMTGLGMPASARIR